MKVAIISVTKNGARLAGRLAGRLGCEAELYAKTGRGEAAAATAYDSLSELVGAICANYDGLIFIMAAGIVVRVIAPHIRDKRSDPAVVVMDETGQYAISLLSGHLGGANDLAWQVARAVGAKPVITTATDVLQRPAADVLAVRLGLKIEPFDRLKAINAAIVDGEQVAFFIDRDLANLDYYLHLAADAGVELADMERLDAGEYAAAVVVTDKQLTLQKQHIFLRPPTLAVGVGCRRGATGADIQAALGDACRRIGRSKLSIAAIGTCPAKENEPGLVAAAQELATQLKVFGNEELQRCIDRHQLATSDFVKQQIGVGNVCESAALLAGQANQLLLPKTVYNNITIAIAAAR